MVERGYTVPQQAEERLKRAGSSYVIVPISAAPLTHTPQPRSPPHLVVL